MQLVDANVILRFILNDNIKLTQNAKNIIGKNHLFLSFEVISEIVYVLQKVYNVPRPDIEKAINTLFDTQNISTNNLDVLKKALELYSNKRIDFVDALLCAHNIVNGDTVHSFDKKVNSIIKLQKL